MEIDLKMLGENIRYLRQGKNLSLADLTKKSGVSKTYISDLENGLGGRPNVQYLYKIATALETTIDALISLSLKPQRKAIPAASREPLPPGDRKSTRLNSSHGYISYAVFCLKKKID